MNQVSLTVNQDSTLQLADYTQTTLSLLVEGILNVYIETLPSATSTLVVYVNGAGELNFNLRCENNSSLDYLWINESNKALNITEKVTVMDYGKLNVNYGEMSNGSHAKDTIYYLAGEHSHVDVRSASITFKQLEWNMTAEHQAKFSEANLSNYAIGLDQSKFVLKVIGHINNGKNGSQTHQTSRIMNLSDRITAVVYPELLIDENDVAASHACTMGQPNPEHVYYLQSRGLTKEVALKTLTLGYLLPITDGIEDAVIQEKLISEITKKVSEQCLI